MNKSKFWLLGLQFLAVSPVFGQIPQEQFIEEEKRVELDRKISYSQDTFIDYGGWESFQLISYDDEPFENRRTLRFSDTRLWASASYQDIHRLYVRGLLQMTDFNDGTGPTRDEDIRGPSLDQGFYEFNWNKLTQAQGWGGYLRLGRQFLSLGRGILFNSVQDGGAFHIETHPVTCKFFASRPPRGTDDFDRSVDKPNRSFRYYYGSELTFPHLIAGQRFYLMGLVERDSNFDHTVGQDFDYNAWYGGIGARGSFFTNTSYQGEIAYEGGKSVASGSTETENIEAWYASFTFNYFPDLPTKPQFAGEWLFGSGDADRGSVTNTVGGNKLDTSDNGFVQFGFAQTGFVLFPRLSNLHVYKATASFFPFDPFVDDKSWTKTFRNFETGVAFYFYRKQRADGVISDPRADKANAFVGSELDVFVRWRIVSDLSASFNYGHFFPGEAYSDATDFGRNFISAGVTFTF